MCCRESKRICIIDYRIEHMENHMEDNDIPKFRTYRGEMLMVKIPTQWDNIKFFFIYQLKIIFLLIICDKNRIFMFSGNKKMPGKISQHFLYQYAFYFQLNFLFYQPITSLMSYIPAPFPLRNFAALKAEYIYKNYGLDCFADDTGLEVEVLGGAPGVYSARYAGGEGHP